MKKLLLTFVVACLGVFSSVYGNETWFEGKFPEKLVNSSGKEVDAAEVLGGKVVAVYFSASWCGPCRAFTPQLVKFYKRAAKKNGIEVVFVSSDKTDGDMKSYMKKYAMPWYAIKFSDAEQRNALKTELKVKGIPSLIVFGKDGKVVTNKGRVDVIKLGAKAAEAWTSSDYKATDSKENKKEEKSSSKKSKKEKKSKKSKKDKQDKKSEQNESNE